MNSQFTRTLPTCCVLQGYQRREQGIRPPAPPQPLKDASASPVLVAVTVPNCRLAAGEELRLVGDSPELGGWELAAAPTLSRSPDGSTWQLVVALAPGEAVRSQCSGCGAPGQAKRLQLALCTAEAQLACCVPTSAHVACL